MCHLTFCRIPASRHLANGRIITSDCYPLRQSSLPNHPGSQPLVFHWVDHCARPFKHEVIRLTPWLYQQELSLIFPFLLFMLDDAILPFRLATFLIFPFLRSFNRFTFPHPSVRLDSRIAGYVGLAIVQLIGPPLFADISPLFSMFPSYDPFIRSFSFLRT